MTQDKNAQTNEPLFLIQNLEYRYHQASRPALSIASLSLIEGECVALVGSNGSGKTTLLKLLNFLLPAQNSDLVRRTIKFRGLPYEKKTARKETVYLHQHPYVFCGSVSHNVKSAVLSRHSNTDPLEILKILHLGNKIGQEAALLSGGEMQRVALARTVANGKSILFLDEPTSGADSTSAEHIIEALMSIKTSKTIIFSTHSVRAAEKLADRILHLDKGQIISDRRPEHAEKSSS